MTKNDAEPYVLRGADGYVLEAIAESIAEGTPAISAAALTFKTSYTRPTIQAAVNRLEAAGYLVVTRGHGRTPNHYRLTHLGKQALL